MLRRTYLYCVAELRSIARLSAPLVAVQLGMMLMNVVDAAMVGHLPGVGAEALAAVALGNLYIWGVSVLAAGVLFSMDAIISQAVGAGDDEAAARAVQRGVVMAVGLAGCVSVAMLPVGPIMSAAGQPEQLVPIVRTYVLINIVATLPFLLFIATRQAMQAMGYVGPIFAAVVAANLANAGLNWVLIYGHVGVPAMGVAGSAWATVLCRCVMVGLLVWLSWGRLRPLLRPWRAGVIARRPMMRMLRLGLPIGGSMAMEFGAFAFIALVMGAMGATTLAAHQIALTLAALAFMAPVGIGQAASVRVGHAIGAGDQVRARRSAVAAMVLGVGWMIVTATLFLAAPGLLARLYTHDAEAIALAVLLIPIAGCFQVFDGIQAVASGVLRGAGDTRGPMFIQAIGLWLIGLPVSVTLALGYGGGPIGLWWGIVAGLGAVALLLCVRLWLRMRGPLERVVIDEPAIADATVE